MGALTNYSDCLTCGSSTFEVEIDGTHNWCLNYCPSGFTAGTIPTCPTPSGTVQVFVQALNSFVGPWTDNGITLNESGTKAAKERGQYFDGVSDTMSFSDFTLHFRFSISLWIRVDELTANQTLLSKDRDTFPNGLVMRVYIIPPAGQLAIDLTEQGNWANVVSTLSTGANRVPAADWVFAGFSSSLNNDSVTTAVRTWINDGTETNNDTVSHHYIDDATAQKTYLGAYRTNASSFADHLKGFIYKIHIFNNAEASGSANYGNAGCDASCSAECTNVSTECMADHDFTEYADSQSCDTTTCNDTSIGCVRDGECQTCSFAHCHLCYDRE